MKLILAQPSIQRFQWELEVLLTNIQQFGDFEVILLFTQHDNTVPQYLADKYGVRCFVYADGRMDKRYIPSVRPYLLWQYLKGDPQREQEQYFYIDSDIIFREWPKLGTLAADPTTWYGSNCGSYIDYDYIIGCEKGPEIAARMAEICGITVDQMKGVPGIGAHILMTNPTADFWYTAYQESLELYDYFNTVDTNLQKWTAEMWAQLWGMVREGISVRTDAELDFATATDDIARWDTVKILHNAGVVDGTDMFFKGKWDSESPLGQPHDYVRRDKCSWKYVDALQKVIL